MNAVTAGNRRDFLRKAFVGAFAAATMPSLLQSAETAAPAAPAVEKPLVPFPDKLMESKVRVFDGKQDFTGTTLGELLKGKKRTMLIVMGESCPHGDKIMPVIADIAKAASPDSQVIVLFNCRENGARMFHLRQRKNFPANLKLISDPQMDLIGMLELPAAATFRMLNNETKKYIPTPDSVAGANFWPSSKASLTAAAKEILPAGAAAADIEKTIARLPEGLPKFGCALSACQHKH